MSALELSSTSSILNSQIKKLKPTSHYIGKNRVPKSMHAIEPYFMIKGFLLEILFKALWLYDGNKLVENGKFTDEKPWCTHNLVPMSEKLNLYFKDDKRKILDKLTKYIYAYGRYPILKKWENDRVSAIVN